MYIPNSPVLDDRAEPINCFEAPLFGRVIDQEGSSSERWNRKNQSLLP